MSSEANLPQDIMIEILSRSPAKTLCGFKCVSKPWRALISDPHLIKRHLTRNIDNNKNNKLIIISPSVHSLYSIEFKDDHEEGVATKLEFQHPNQWAKIMGSCNGLLFVVSIYNNNFLLNPSTREFTRLPALPYVLDPGSARVVYGFGFDCSSDDYKVVAIVYKNGDECDSVDHSVDVYSVKSREWRRIGKSVYDHPVSVPWQGVFLNGCIHWLAYKNEVFVIASFDLADEVFHDLPTPAVFGSDLPRAPAAVLFYDLLVLGGCLCVVACRRNRWTDIWMMKEYGIGESWIQFSIRRPDLYPIKPFGLLEEKEMLLRVYGAKMVKHNLEDQTVEDMVVKGIPDEYEVGVTYVESIVSPSFSNGDD